jgi:hypothetical protein
MSKKWLTARWVRYIVLPIVAGLPSGAAAYWFNSNSAEHGPFLLKDHEPAVFALTAAWALIVTMAKSYLEDIAKNTIEKLQAAQEELAHLINFVRIVVGAKSRRFYEALEKLPENPDPGRTFFQITQPQTQIKQLLEAVHGYFKIKVDPSTEGVKVSLMRPCSPDTLRIVEWFPDGDAPTARNERFDGGTMAGLAFVTRQLVISESIVGDDRYKHFRGRDEGSMFAYPVVDTLKNEVVFVINVVSTKMARFKDAPAPREKIKAAMEIFAERMILENRLALIKDCVLANKDGGETPK